MATINLDEYTRTEKKQLQKTINGWRGIEEEIDPSKYIDKDPF